MRRILKTLLPFAAALLAAELLLRAIYPPVLFFETWHSNGIHQPDARMGFVFRPNYQGYMQHADGVYRPVPIALDQHGFRLLHPGRVGRPVVHLVGGRSMMYCYGLPDRQTISHRLGEALDGATTRNTAWPGVDLYHNWLVYREKLADEHPDWLVISIYKENPDLFWSHAPDFRDYPPAPPPEKFFRVFDGIAIGWGPFVNRLGPRAKDSYLLFGCVGILEDSRDLLRRVERKIEHTLNPRKVFHDAVGGKDGLDAFLRYVSQTAHAEGSRVLVVFLPQRDKGPGHYDPIRSSIPEGLDLLDLQAELIEDAERDGWMADGHYKAATAERIGRRIAAEIKALEAAAAR